MASEDTLATQVENLNVSGEVKQIPQARTPRGAKENKRPEKVDDADDGVLREPKIRSEHDNRFNYPNRTYGRDGGRGRDNYGSRDRSDRDNWGAGRGRDGDRDREQPGRGSGRDGDSGRDRESFGRGGRDRGGRDVNNRGDREFGGRGGGRDDREREGGFGRGNSRVPRRDDRAAPQQDKNYLEQQRARAEQRRIKMQVMMERQKDYVAKQKTGGEEEPEKHEEERNEYNEEEGKDDGDVWGHDGWDKIIHDHNPRRKYKQERNEEPKKEEAGRYVNPHLRSQPKQEEWTREQEARKQQRAQENEQRKLEDEVKKKERAERKQFVRPLYVPPQRKAAQLAKSSELQDKDPENMEANETKAENDAEHKNKAQSDPSQGEIQKDEKEDKERREGEEENEEEGEEGEEGEEEDDEEDDDDEYEDVEEGGSGGEGIVLIMQVEISPGLSKALQVRNGDDPAEVAERFCVEHGMAAKFIPTLTKNIQHHISQQDPNT